MRVADGQDDYSCMFDSDLASCNLRQDTADRADWVIGRTGDMGTSGSYAYLPLSTPVGSAARMLTSNSAISTQGKAYTVSFKYYADADIRDTISVLVKKASGTFGRLRIQGNKGGFPWRRAQVQLHEMEPFQVILEARAGPTYGQKGVLAIDELTARLGPANMDKGEVDEVRVRLVDGPSSAEGIVQVMHNNVWGTVCRDGWGAREAKVVCAMLGMSGGRTRFLPDYSGSTWNEQVPVHLDDVRCVDGAGSDVMSLAMCHHRGWGNTDCIAREYATVRCNEEEVAGKVVGQRLRLGSHWEGNDKRFVIGRVEVFYQGAWGTVCDNSWDSQDSMVVCRMFGAESGQVYRYPSGPPGPGGKVLSDVRCAGTEGSLFDCDLGRWGQNTCPPGGANAWVQCQFPAAGKLPVDCEFDNPSDPFSTNDCGFHGDSGSLNPWRFDSTQNSYPYDKYGGQVGVTMHVDTYASQEGIARTVSPRLGRGIEAAELCVAFIYLRTDRRAGDLTVRQKIQGVTTPVFWSDTDNNYNVWREVVLSLYAKSAQLELEVGVGPRLAGSVLVDHFRAFRGSCDQHWDKWVSGGGGGTLRPTDGAPDTTRRPTTRRPTTRRPATDRPTTSSRSSTRRPTTTLSPVTDLPTTGSFGMLCNFNEDDCVEFMEHVTEGATAAWTRQNGTTPSVDTGPDTDFDLGTLQGYYMYLEATGLKTGDNARIRTHGLVAQAGPQCLVFGYYMYGHNMGTLSVYTADEAGNYDVDNILFRKKGNQGKSWGLGLVDIPVNEKGRRMVFEAVRGKDYTSDIAMDWLILTDGSCCLGDTWMDCSFDSLGTCCYRHDYSADFDWTWTSGSTASQLTGPTVDHTTGTQEGGYHYIEASDPAQGEVARLMSPLSPAGSYCVTFWYHMYGRNIGTLTVKTADNTAIPWTRSGDQGNTWQQGKIFVPYGSTRAVFEVQVAGGVEGDVAIDDVTWERTSSC